MKFIGLPALALAAVLAGCAAPAEETVSHMTQSIASEPLAASQPEEEGDYYYWKAMKEALEIELGSLEARYRVGEVPEEEFRQKKEELEREIREAKAQKEVAEVDRRQEDAHSRAEYDPELEEELELAQEELEEIYRRLEITRQEFVSQWAELEKQDDVLDELEDQMEDDEDDEDDDD